MVLINANISITSVKYFLCHDLKQNMLEFVTIDMYLADKEHKYFGKIN